MIVCTFKIILKPKSSLRNCISFISACPLGLISNSPSNSTSAGLAYMDDAIGISAWTKPLYSPEFTHGKLYNNIYTNQAPINKTEAFLQRAQGLSQMVLLHAGVPSTLFFNWMNLSRLFNTPHPTMLCYVIFIYKLESFQSNKIIFAFNNIMHAQQLT